MRDLGSSSNKAIIRDGISNSEIELSYRTPTTSELQRFYTNSITRKGGKSTPNAVAARVAFALDIATGIRDGDFGIEGKPISSDPQSPDYYSDWKKVLAEKAPDILDAFVFATFEAARFQSPAEIAKDETELPLATS